MSTLKVNTVRPVTTDGSLTLQGDSSGAGVTGAKVFGDGSLGADSITDLAGTGAPDFSNGWKSEGKDAYACRAWVNFDGSSGSGTGSSDITIRGSGNVSSVTDRGTGDYEVNFSNSMPDNDYCVSAFSGNDGATSLGRLHSTGASFSTSSVRVRCSSLSGAADDAVVNVAVFR